MNIGKKLKRLRIKHQLTLEELANRSELSKGFLSQLENDNCSPSISTLEDLLEVLGSSLQEFFSEKSEETIVFSEKDYYENVQEEYKIDYLVPNAQKNAAEPIRITIFPGGRSQEIIPHDGEDFGYVLKGRATLVYGGEKHHLKKGDTFYVRCNENYYIENKTKSDCELIWISTPPFF
ncbi:MAG: cupin domain-containing protein [Ruminococcaceae bacterium]|nr:cupin domain-containing protein [Oscillospiraceae bacterium]